MAYTTQQWTAPQGTGLNRYAKGAETSTHITLTLDPENLTNSPTPVTVARLNHMESGIAEAHAIENVYPIEWRENALGQTSRYWRGMTTLGTDVYACVDGGDIYKQTGGTGNFVALEQDTRYWRGMTTLGNDVYACVYNGDIYKQTGGTGNFVALRQTSRSWFGMTTLGTDVYACVGDGDIYKQTGGTGKFVALRQTSEYWFGMTTLGNDVYACVDGGDIYKQTGGTGKFVALSQTSRSWVGMTTLGNDVYACVYNGDIYKQTGGVGDFIALSQTSEYWFGMTTLGNDVYACVYNGDIYKLSLSNTIRASASFTLSAYPDGSRKRIANTHASNTITVTMPSGYTMNGQSSFTIAPDTILEFEVIGTAWKCISKELEKIWTNPNIASPLTGNLTLSGSIAQFKFYEIVYAIGVSESSQKLVNTTGLMPIDKLAFITTSYGDKVWRPVTAISGTTLTIGAATQRDKNDVDTVNTSGIIPHYIYGIK